MARSISAAGLAIMALGISDGVMSQQSAGRAQLSPAEVTATSCEVQIGDFESACDSLVSLLDSKEVSALYVTVKSIPEEHEITFYTEHVGMLVVGMDGGMMVTLGRCRNNARSLRCRSDDRAVVLEIRW
jgi:hypothetical protein